MPALNHLHPDLHVVENQTHIPSLSECYLMNHMTHTTPGYSLGRISGTATSIPSEILLVLVFTLVKV